MVNVGVKMSDIGYAAADSGTTGSTGVKSSSSDQFKKLLQTKQDNSQQSSTQEVSKDTAQDKAEAAKPSKEDVVKDSKAETKEEVKESKETLDNTEDTQTQGLLAAYQLSQGLRPELFSAEPEIVIEVPEIVVEMPAAVQEMPEMAVDLTASEAVTAFQTEDLPVQADMQAAFSATEGASRVQAQTESVQQATAVVQAEEKPQAAEQIKASEAQMASTETVRTPLERRDVVKAASALEENTQTEKHEAEQSVAAAVTQAPVHTVAEVTNHQESTTVYVSQPEELPGKVADQLMAKLEEGVQEFEIQIEPANLGKIAIKIVYEAGQATVSIFCTEKKALDALGLHAREIGGIIDRNLGGETKIFVEKQDTDYLNQEKDENEKGQQEEQGQQKGGNKKKDTEDSAQFLQKLRLGLAD